MQRLILSGAAPEDCAELRVILEAEKAWQLRWVSSLRELPSILDGNLPNVLLILVPADGGLGALGAFTEILSRAARSIPTVVVFSASASEQDLCALPDGAEFVMAPLCAVEVRTRIRRLLHRDRARSEADTCAQLTERLGLDAVLGEHATFVSIKAKLPAIARAGATVLLSGETGTGKEVIARAIHYLSRRTHGPFIPVDCGAIPVELFENELFGHRRGAFTDARSSETGLIAEAECGTLFLDEVDSIPLVAQTKLLRFLQHQTYRPLGSLAFLRANVRIVAATNADLEARIKAGAFREDLYYRLNIIPIAVPALRERRSDIALLARHFLGKYGIVEGGGAWQFAPGVLEVLQDYRWPGNVRELENVIQHVLAVNQPGPIGLDVLPVRLCTQGPGHSPHSFREAKAQAVAAFERDYTAGVLSAHSGNVTRAAQAAGTDRRVFGRLVKKHGIRSAVQPQGQASPRAG